MQPLLINWASDPNEEYEHWCEVYGQAIEIGDKEVINQLKEILPELEARC